MNEDHYPGPMSMVKIDGIKIKRLRERQGLTQLYLATAVEVTTDTISRWENRRYPSIKRENGIRLAEALGVGLDEIIDIEVSEEVAEVAEEKTPHPQENTIVTPPPEIPSVKGLRYSWPLLILSGTLFVIILGFLYSYFNIKPAVQIYAERILPKHSVSGQPFPVIIKVTGEPGATTALIIKEELPARASLLASSPKIAGDSGETSELKWLGKVGDHAIFGYVLAVDGTPGETVILKGTTASSGGDEKKDIGGTSQLEISTNHWADTDKDNVISDKEILTVYDLYSELPGLNLDIDAIEEMWLGSGYRWDGETSTFQVID